MKRIIPFFTFTLIGIVIVADIFAPIISSLFTDVKYNVVIYRYIFVIMVYLSILFLMCFAINDLGIYNLDLSTLIILIIFGFFRSTYDFLGDIYFRIPIYILNIGILTLLIINFHKIPKTNPRWVLIGLLSCLLIIPIAFINSLQPQMHLRPSLNARDFLLYAIRNTLLTLSFISPFEEITIRGIFWGQLRHWGWNDNKIFWIQAVVFWLLHISQLFSTPLAFLITLPIMTLIFSILVRYSKQVFPSIILHTFADAFGPLLKF